MKTSAISSFIFLAVFAPTAAWADIVVTEIMYDLPSGSDSGREWIEVYNTGTSAVKLTDWKFLENGTNHKITAVSGGADVQPNSYAVIADTAANFRADWPQFSGQLFDSAFSLSNAGETIALHDASSTMTNSVSYQSAWGASGDENTLNRVPNDIGVFVARTPSPDAAMSATAISPPPPPPKPVVTVKQKQVSPVRTKTAVREVVPEPTDPNNVEDLVPVEVAAASATSQGSYVWWLGAGALAIAAAGALVAARRAGKREWDIVEE
jgi:hypothetical protein